MVEAGKESKMLISILIMYWFQPKRDSKKSFAYSKTKHSKYVKYF